MEKVISFISKNKGLLCILSVLILLIIGLSVGIYITQTQQDYYNSSILPDGDTVSVAASNLYYDMIEKFQSEPDFSSEDAVAEFENRIKNTKNNAYSATLALWCSKFINDYGDGPQIALDYLENYFNENSQKNFDDSTLIDYYDLASTFAQSIDDTKKVDYYEQKAEELITEQRKVKGDNVYYEL